MADEEAKEDEAPKKNSGLMLAIAVPAIVGLISGAAGFAIAAYVPAMINGDTEEVVEAIPPAFHEFGEIVANLDEGELARYLRLKITLQISGEKETELVETITKQHSVLRSWLISYISDKQMADIRGAAGQNALRRDIQNKFNQIIAPDGIEEVQDILFEEFQIQ